MANDPTNPIYPANGLEIELLGLPTVINDGQTENSLQILFTNNNFLGSLHTDRESTIVLSSASPIYIWFVVDVKQASETSVREWALTSYDAFHDAKVAITASPGNWRFERWDNLAGNTLNESLNGWRLVPDYQQVMLHPGQSLLVTVSGLTSGLPDGPTYCYCQVDLPNLDEYGDVASSLTKVIGPILKSKLMISDDLVQIGSNKHATNLAVYGSLYARGPLLVSSSIHSSFTNRKGHPDGGFFVTSGPKNTGMTLTEDGGLGFQIDDTRNMTIRADDGGFTTEIVGNLTLSDPDTGILHGHLKTAGDATVGGSIWSQSGRVKDQWGPVMPVGAIIAYGGNTAPNGWLLCDGRSLDRPEPDEWDEWAELRDIVGNRVPDLRDRFLVGSGGKYRTGNVGGEAEHVLAFDEMPTHRHGMYVASNQEANYGYVGDEGIKQQWYAKVADRKGPVADPYSGSYRDDIRAKTIIEAGGGLAHNNMPPYYALTYIIKY